MKKGFVFTMDILVGLIIVVSIILSFNFLRTDLNFKEQRYQKLNYQSQDIINVLSSLKVNEIQDSQTIQNLITQGVLKQDDLDKSILDISTSLFYAGNKSAASQILQGVLQNISSDICMEVSIFSETVYQSCNKTQEDEYAVSTRIETGYDIGKPSEGFTSRAFLTSIVSKTNNAYLYFGGYVGDGNITVIVELPENSDVKSVYMELDSGTDFNLYVNGNFSGSYISNHTRMKPTTWFVCNQFNPAYCDYFISGNNTLQLNFTKKNDNFIGGGFVRITYDTSQLSPPETSNEGISYFPGIFGIINLYSSFYVPGDLNYMSAYLHFRNNYTTFFNIGNKTIYRTNSSTEQKINLTNSQLSSLLNYSFYSGKTVPLRLGTEAFQTFITGFGVGDSVLVTDLSGSMEWCSNEPPESDPHTQWRWMTWTSGGSTYGAWRWVDVSACDNGAKRNIEIAKDANNLFVDSVMNISGNRIGMADYTGSSSVYNYTRSRWITMFPDNLAGAVDLTYSSTTLKNHINGMDTWWGTCICCGINKARQILNDQSNSTRKKSIVLMSDGEANIRCSQQGTGNAKQDAILAGQQACSNNITVYTVGYGLGADEATLKAIACNQSQYFNATDVNDMLEIYRRIAEEVSEGSFQTQTLNATGNVSMNNILYTDSYIKFGFNPFVNPMEYGEIELTRETSTIGNMSNFNSTPQYVEGSYYIYPELKVVDAKVTSYSSEYWTDRVSVRNGNSSQWTSVYSLSDYGSNYQIMGDPFIVQIPSNLIKEGENNYIRVGTGLAPDNSTGGSEYGRVIYDVRLKGSVGYGDVFNTSELAINDARQRLADQVSSYVNISVDDIQIENQTISGMKWLWGPSLIKVIAWEK